MVSVFIKDSNNNWLDVTRYIVDNIDIDERIEDDLNDFMVPSISISLINMPIGTKMLKEIVSFSDAEIKIFYNGNYIFFGDIVSDSISYDRFEKKINLSFNHKLKNAENIDPTPPANRTKLKNYVEDKLNEIGLKTFWGNILFEYSYGGMGEINPDNLYYFEDVYFDKAFFIDDSSRTFLDLLKEMCIAFCLTMSHRYNGSEHGIFFNHREQLSGDSRNITGKIIKPFEEKLEFAKRIDFIFTNRLGRNTKITKGDYNEALEIKSYLPDYLYIEERLYQSSVQIPPELFIDKSAELYAKRFGRDLKKISAGYAGRFIQLNSRVTVDNNRYIVKGIHRKINDQIIEIDLVEE